MALELKVVFRKDKKTGEIMCIFLECDEGDNKLSAYTHTGQHFIADYDYLLKDTKTATIQERKELLREVQSIGYSPVIQKKLTKKYMEVK